MTGDGFKEKSEGVLSEVEVLMAAESKRGKFTQKQKNKEEVIMSQRTYGFIYTT